MLDAVTITQMSLLSDLNKLQTIAQNITNMQTLGYKSQINEFNNFNTQLVTSINKHKTPVNTSRNYITTNLQGPLFQTHKPTDLALSSDGFFTIKTPTGLFYTRRGDFHVNVQGELATATGGLLLGNTGPIFVQDKDFNIDKTGAIFIDNQKIDELSIEQFVDTNQLNYLGEGLYEASLAPLRKPDKPTILQGFIEQSNVKSQDEMLAMIKTSRHFETGQKVMQTANFLLSEAVKKLGEANV